jgi:class 3 adenylate cyclase
MLTERNQHPDRADEIDAEIRALFERKVAVLALDMCGFTQLSAKRGILFYLAMIRQMEECARPAVEGNRGRLVKLEADNLFAVFESPADAVEAALDVLRAFVAVNSVVPDDRDLHGSIGIGYGEMLVIGDHDLFGIEMNHACKLGEDLAGKMEILLTPPAREAIPDGLYRFTPISLAVGGRELTCHRLEGRAERPAVGE